MALSSSELCSIIETCGRMSVSSIKISNTGVEIKFDEPQRNVEVNMTLPEFIASKSEPQATPNAPSGDFSNDSQYFEQDPKELADQDELAELQITNPLEYEERLARGDLVDAEKENG